MGVYFPLGGASVGQATHMETSPGFMWQRYMWYWAYCRLYVLYTNSEPPVNLSEGQEKQNGIHSNWSSVTLTWKLTQDALGTVAFNQHVQLFRRALQWMNNQPNVHLFPCQARRKVDSLKLLGLSAWHRGYTCRPQLACGARTLIALRNYFITDSGTRRDLSLPYVKLNILPSFMTFHDIHGDRGDDTSLTIFQCSFNIWASLPT